jgi:hypothetical protein
MRIFTERGRRKKEKQKTEQTGDKKSQTKKLAIK